MSFGFNAIQPISPSGGGGASSGDQVSLDNTNFKVLTGDTVQIVADEADVALLNARSTGVRTGGDLTDLGSGVVRISAGSGSILSNPDPSNPTYYDVTWSQTDLDLSGADGVYFICANNTGVVTATTDRPSHVEYRECIWLWRVSIRSGIVSGTTSIVQPIQQHGPQLWDIFKALGQIKTGLVLSANGANLSVDIGAGEVYTAGINFYNDPENPHETDIAYTPAVTFRMVDRNGNQSADTTSLVVGQWDNNGTIESISGSSSRATIITCALFPGSLNYRFFYGQAVYNSVDVAQEALFDGLYTPVLPANYSEAVILGYIIVEKGATNLSDGIQKFITSNRFGLVGGAISSSGVGALLSSNNLADLDDPNTAIANLGITATATELNFVDGVVSPIQAQLGGKASVLPIANAADDLVPLAAGTNAIYTHAQQAFLDRTNGDVVVQETTGTPGSYIYYRTVLKGNGVDFSSYITTLGLTRAGGVILKPADGDHPDLADYQVKLPAAAPTTGQVLGVSDSDAEELVWKNAATSPTPTEISLSTAGGGTQTVNFADGGIALEMGKTYTFIASMEQDAGDFAIRFDTGGTTSKPRANKSCKFIGWDVNDNDYTNTTVTQTFNTPLVTVPFEGSAAFKYYARGTICLNKQDDSLNALVIECTAYNSSSASFIKVHDAVNDIPNGNTVKVLGFTCTDTDYNMLQIKA